MRAPFTARIVVDTGDDWGSNAIRTLTGLEPECHVLRFGDLTSHPFDWPDLVREAFRRIVQVSVETVAVVESLPCPFSESEAHGERP